MTPTIEDLAFSQAQAFKALRAAEAKRDEGAAEVDGARAHLARCAREVERLMQERAAVVPVVAPPSESESAEE